MRKTHALMQVATELLAEPGGKHYGYDLAKRSGVRSGVLYPMLTRLVDAGWLNDGWEDPTTIEQRRPPRRYYELTEDGTLQLGGLIAEARSDARFASLKERWT
ncbi:PadR family transcriptional regulator [Streptomyces sp. NBC_01455]|uniref:PadR family transcriptional regulator n=1 Tax=Streptomyces sp. NBC_01455 TaxID=2903874 RepID=UPI002E33FD81|nr:helix-turn-helix transcriptional regulator [Streptomyces sp. NBC_01455]